MLTLTENAQAAVRGLTQDVEQPTAGLRIASEQDQLAVSVVTQPQPTVPRKFRVAFTDRRLARRRCRASSTGRATRW